jgi:hypothetical protein
MKYLLILSLFLLSCSPMNRLQNLQKNHAYLFEKAKDTVAVNFKAEIVTPKVELDTVFKVSTDTVFIAKEKLRIKFIYKDSIAYIDATCESDTIYIDTNINAVVDVFNPPALSQDSSISKWYIALALVLAILTTILILKFKK